MFCMKKVSIRWVVTIVLLSFVMVQPVLAVELESGSAGIEMPEILVGAPKVEIKETLTERVPALTTKAKVTAEEIKTFNAVNVEDTIKYLPNLFVRKRFIGDPNSVFSIRGNSNFQTARHMVFSDGFPLHNLLQSRFNGSPKWHVVAPEEIESTEVIYGPFSAAYSGNAMGGVVNMKTRQPQTQEVTVKQSYFFQDYSLFGTQEIFDGFNSHASYGDKISKFSFFTFYDHLESTSHPLTLRSNTTLVAPQVGLAAETAVTGAFRNLNINRADQVIYGDTGSEEITTDLFKVKGNFELTPDLTARATLAYVNRNRETDPNNFLRDGAGNTIWGDGSDATTDAQFNGVAFNVRSQNFAVDIRDKQDLLIGAGLDGKLGGGWEFDLAFTYFSVIEDLRRQSTFHPDDPQFDGKGRVTEFDDTGWETYDIKIGNEAVLGNPDVALYAGYHYSHYSLETSQFESDDFRFATKEGFRNSSGGDTSIHAAFVQSSWKFMPKWKATVGGRQEWWNAKNGFNNVATGGSPTSGAEPTPDRNQSEFSPKFALEYKPTPLWTTQFSLAKAYRFPIVEELFQNIRSQNSTALANADLKTEDGLHKAFSIRREIDGGNVQVTFFEDLVKDAIFNQQDAVTLVSAVLNVDKVRTRGIEFAFGQSGFVLPKLDVQFNTSYIDSKILENDRLPSSVGNRFPRVPKWRVNLLANYHITKAWDASAGLRYADSSFNTIPNTDKKEGFGSQSNFLVVDLKTTYGWKNGLTASFGIDNVNNDEYFVFHPFPQRTFLFGLEWSLPKAS
jgi:iron complex outermembrane receptor protein